MLTSPIQLWVRLTRTFTAEAVPPANNVKGGSSVVYTLAGTSKGATIEVARHFALNDLMYPRDNYGILRGIFLNIKTSDDSQLVFTSSGDAKPATASAAAPATKN